MVAALLLLISLGVCSQAPTATPQPDPKLIRVHVQTDDGGDASELAARRESVKHLSSAIAGKNKANPESMLSAINLARRLAAQRT